MKMLSEAETVVRLLIDQAANSSNILMCATFDILR